ncbi:MAG: hypothetical protein U9R08_03035 [Nanoarchaeota archaeon]|nr:hypothetical protein [Nanoarchaeota archaeon]
MILATVGIIVYVRYSAVKPSVGISEIVPEEVAPVKVFVEECLQQVATRGLEIAGEQGGYIDPESWGLIYRENDPTSGNAIEFTSLVPYWFHLGADNDCSGTCWFGSEKPPLRIEDGNPSIQSMVEQYVLDNIDQCFRNFNSFPQYEVVVEGEKEITSIIARNNVVYNFKLPLKIDSGSTKAKISQFSSTVQIALPALYDLSSTITDTQAQYCFLEHDVIELISIFSGVEKNKFPPMSEMRMDSTPVIWFTRDVKEKMQELLQSYIPLLQMENSLNFKQLRVPDTVANSDMINRMYSNMIIPLDATGYTVYFDYLSDWDIYFDMGKGNMIKPDGFSVPFLGFGMQKYDFGYDVSFPVIVTVNDPTALGGRGYNFKFALEENIRNNRCLESNFENLDISKVSGTSMLCDNDKRNSGLINISVKDEEGIPVVGAFITFASDDACPLGTTDGSGEYADNFPVAIGTLNIDHPNYLATTKAYSTSLDEDDEQDIVLQKSRNVKLKILKKNYIRQPGWAFNNFELGLDFKEEAILTFTRVPEEGETEYTTISRYSGEMSSKNEFSDVELYPGTYDVSILLFSYRPLRIPESHREEGGFFDSVEFTIPEVNMEQWQSGGLEMKELSGRWTVSANDLDRADHIKFYTIGFYQNDMLAIEDLDHMSKLEQYTQVNRPYLEPRIEI